jgi:two-component system phosphate regulon response regulator OmpR
MNTLLIVDDDKKICDLLAHFLKDNHFRVITALNAAEARSQLACHKFDMLILDVMMPHENGFELAKGIRKTNNVPIIFLTAKDDVQDRIMGLDIGGDDYIVKPFDPHELLARIRSHLRRLTPQTPSTNILKFGEFTFDSQLGTLKQNGTDVPLSSTETVLFKILAQAPGEPFHRDELSQRMGFKVSNRTIDVQITRLRRKIEHDIRHPKYIQTVRHIGYALCPDTDNIS